MRTSPVLHALAAVVVAAAPAAAQSRAGNETLTAVPGIRVGHHTLSERPTGCTVVLVDGDAVGGFGFLAQRLHGSSWIGGVARVVPGPGEGKFGNSIIAVGL